MCVYHDIDIVCNVMGQIFLLLISTAQQPEEDTAICDGLLQAGASHFTGQVLTTRSNQDRYELDKAIIVHVVCSEEWRVYYDIRVHVHNVLVL